MKFFKRPIFWLLVAIGLFLGIARPNLPAAGQFAQIDRLVINYTESIPFKDKPGLTLRVYFTPLDVAGRAVTGVPVRTTSLILDADDAGEYPSSKAQPVQGSTVTMLVLDTSGSMGKAVDDLIEASVNLVKGTPNESFYSLITFSDKILGPTKFSADKKELERTIRTSVPGANGGTCLYDATMRALQSVAENVPNGRRAIVVFTDGNDTADGSDKPCSKATLQDVIKFANNIPVPGSTDPDQKVRIPIYTLAFKAKSDSKVATQELQTMATTTGGFYGEASNIRDLFNNLVNSFNAMLVTETQVFPHKGLRNVAVSLVLNTGAQDFRGVGKFYSPEDFSVQNALPTITPSITPSLTATKQLSFTIDPPRFDYSKREFLVTIKGIVTGQIVAKWEINLIGEDGLRKNSVVAPKTTNTQFDTVLPFPDDMPQQKVTIQVRPFGFDDGLITEQTVGAAVVYTPTPVPSATVTLSPTPVPTIFIDGVTYEDPVGKGTVTVNMRFVQPEMFSNVRIALINKDTNTSPKVYADFPRAPSIKLDLTNVPKGGYRIEARPIGTTGEQNGVGAAFEFAYDPPVTPTVTVSPTATEVIHGAAITNLQINRDLGEFVFSIQTLNPEPIKTYRFNFINTDTGESTQVRPIQINGNYSEIHLPWNNLPAGKYVVRLNGLNDKGEVITDASDYAFAWNPPIPTATPTPIPSPTPEPKDLGYLIGKWLADPQTRPIVLGVFGAFIVGILFIAFVALRPRRKPKTGTDFLASMTGAVDISKMQAEAKKMAKTNKPQAPAASASPAAMGMMEGDKTAAVPHLSMPTASINVEMSRDQANLGKSVPVTHTPFTLGRKNRDLNFDNDDNVSRGHAEILFENGVYMVQDNNSTHGTFVDDRQVPPGTRTPLYNGAGIRLGTTTVLRFMMQDSGFGGPTGGFGGDSERTNPENPMYRR